MVAFRHNTSMPSDHYETLGVSRQATPDEIQKAYRQMARKYHPDLNPNDAKAKENFQKVQAAFDVLNDPQKRQRYDQFGDAYESFGGGGPQTSPHPWAGAGGPGAGGFEVNLEDLFGGGAAGMGGGGPGGFADLFKQFKQRNKRAAPTKGSNVEHTLTVPFATAILGGEAQIALQREDGHNESLRVKIPAGIEPGKKIRLRGKGEQSPTGGAAGDLLIKVEVAPHPHFRRTGNRLDVRVPVSLAEAVGGAKIEVPSPYGTITLTIPPGTSSGSKLRVKGQGVKHSNGEAGDLFAEIMVVVPKDFTPADRAGLLDVLKKYPQNVRAELRW
jgi:DnaJ-class molecular chaperone